MSGNFDYHYSRKERLGMPGAPGPADGSRSLFRRNRGLMILLIDIIVIVIAVILYRQFLYEPAYSAELAGYRVALRGFAIEDRVIVDLRITGTARAEPAAQRLFAVFRAGRAETRLSAELPAAGESTGVTGVLLGAGSPSQVEAEVSIGTATATVRRDLP